MKTFFFAASVAAILFSCKQPGISHASKLDQHWLDSIIKNSDSSYTKPYFRIDFVTAGYYFSKKDSSLCQVMKDSAGRVRQISIAVKNIRSFYGQYYSNGQLVAWLPFDSAGQYNGESVYYYEDGKIQSSGTYSHGFKTGKWKNYDPKGTLTGTETFDSNGQLLQQ